jgi:hypothetical protein
MLTARGCIADGVLSDSYGLDMRTVIFSGIIGEVGRSSSRYKGGLSFTLGEPPVAFYSPGGLEGAPFRPGDYVAIAARRTFVPGVQYAALAYRNWGTKGTGQTVWCHLAIALSRDRGHGCLFCL